MEEAVQSSYLLSCLCLFLFFLCCFANISPVIRLLIRPCLASTLNNLSCVILLTNMSFGCLFFLIRAVVFSGSDLILFDYVCSAISILPQYYRVVSLYLILGSLFLRSLFVKHAKYISVVSKNNMLVVSDFGIPIWVTIGAFIVLNSLFMMLHPNFPLEFPHVRTCRGLGPYQNKDDVNLQFQVLLMSIIGSLVLASFVVSIHVRLHQYMRKKKRRYRQNVNTTVQTLAGAYVKLGTSFINTTMLHWHIASPDFIPSFTLQVLEGVAMFVECIVVPLIWLEETSRNFPELSSSRNKRLCVYPGQTSQNNSDHFEIIVSNRPLSPRRPNFAKNFNDQALGLIVPVTQEESNDDNLNSTDKKVRISTSFHSENCPTPLPPVHI